MLDEDGTNWYGCSIQFLRQELMLIKRKVELLRESGKIKVNVEFLTETR